MPQAPADPETHAAGRAGRPRPGSPPGRPLRRAMTKIFCMDLAARELGHSALHIAQSLGPTVVDTMRISSVLLAALRSPPRCSASRPQRSSCFCLIARPSSRRRGQDHPEPQSTAPTPAVAQSSRAGSRSSTEFHTERHPRDDAGLFAVVDDESVIRFTWFDRHPDHITARDDAASN